MNWQLFTYTCLNGHAFTEAELPVADYGILVMRGEQSGERRLLNALEDPVFAEVDALLADTAVGRMSALARADMLHGIFGIASDLDAGGGRFRIGLGPRCPVCDTREMAEYRASEPAQFLAQRVPHITHEAWLGFSAPERAARVATAVAQMIDLDSMA